MCSFPSSTYSIFLSALLCAVVGYDASGATSDWTSAPRPKFPKAALKNGAEGSVKLRAVVGTNGVVVRTSIVKSSGDPTLDATAQKAVLKWRMEPSAIQPSDLTVGRETIVEFRQEAAIAAVYPDRTAYFNKFSAADKWAFAPFPSYPEHVRELRHAGTVLVQAVIGEDGRVASVSLVRSSGYNDLDQLAMAAVRLWRAHKQFAGKKYKIPIRFSLVKPRRAPAPMVREKH